MISLIIVFIAVIIYFIIEYMVGQKTYVNDMCLGRRSVRVNARMYKNLKERNVRIYSLHVTPYSYEIKIELEDIWNERN